MRTLLFAAALSLVSVSVSRADLVFDESMGTVASTTSYATHTSNMAWDNDGLTFTGTGDVRATTPSSGYIGASGIANVFLTDNGTASFQISSINTLGFLPTFTLSFGAWKELTASNMTQLSLAYSDDGTNYTSIPIQAQATGAGTAVWRLLTFSGLSLPNVADLRLRWINTGVGTSQFRIDDVMLEGTAVPEPQRISVRLPHLRYCEWCLVVPQAVVLGDLHSQRLYAAK